MAKRERARTAKRRLQRSLGELARDQQKLSLLEIGGAPNRPIEVISSSVIDVRARSLPCPLCDGESQLEEQTAEKFSGHPLRAAHMRCKRCGIARVLWFRIIGSGAPLQN